MGIDLESCAIKVAGMFLYHPERGFPRVSVQLENPLASVTAGPRDRALQSVVHHGNQFEVSVGRPMTCQNSANRGVGIFRAVERDKNILRGTRAGRMRFADSDG